MGAIGLIDYGNLLNIDREWAKDVMAYIEKKADRKTNWWWSEMLLCLMKVAADPRPINSMIKMLEGARRKSMPVLVFGNGGSAATASHFVCDLNKTAQRAGANPFHASCLSDNTSLITAWANDFDYASVFTRQLPNHGLVRGVVVGISCSGNSRNVLDAIQHAKVLGAITIGLTGGGGKLGDVVDISIKVPSEDALMIEGIHSVILHYVTQRLRE